MHFKISKESIWLESSSYIILRLPKKFLFDTILISNGKQKARLSSPNNKHINTNFFIFLLMLILGGDSDIQTLKHAS